MRAGLEEALHETVTVFRDIAAGVFGGAVVIS